MNHFKVSLLQQIIACTYLLSLVYCQKNDGPKTKSIVESSANTSLAPSFIFGDGGKGSSIGKVYQSPKSHSKREASRFEENEVGWTNINEEVDMTIPLVLSHFKEVGMTHFDLPNVKEGVPISAILGSYLVELLLYNGSAFNLEGIYRYEDAMMTYHPNEKAFEVRLKLIIKKLQFEYDFLARAMILSIGGGVVGNLQNVLISVDLSVSVQDFALILNDFQVLDFGRMIVQLNHNRIVQDLSTIVLTPITNIFRDRITTTISSDLKQIISDTLYDFSSKDNLGIKKYAKKVLSGLIRSSMRPSENKTESELLI